MEANTLETLKYPIGKFVRPEVITPDEVNRGILTIQNIPGKLKLETKGLDEAIQGYKHRPGGWTIKQLVHHIADSHLHAYIRTKLALTENNPRVTPYMEEEWAKTIDSADAPMEWSLMIAEGLHYRWAKLLSSLRPEQLKKTYFHPQHNKNIEIVELIPLYAWHGEHHLAQLKQAKQYKNNFPGNYK